MNILVLGAGGPAGINACRALTAAGHSVSATETNELRIPLLEHHVSALHIGDPDWEKCRGYDLVIAQPDVLVMRLADNADGIRTFLPDRRVIALCQDKFECGLQWRRRRLRDDKVLLVQDYDTLRDAYLEHNGELFWLRARHGAGAKGAILARSLQEAQAWLDFWLAREPSIDFVAEEYLPGRDLAWTSIWCRGELVTSFARERVEYIYPHLTPEGLTGTPTVATVVHDDRVNEVAVAAVAAVDDEPHGIYSVDLREDAGGVPRPTEINAGRGFTTLGLWSLFGSNFLDVAARVAVHGRGWWLNRPDLPEPERLDALPEGLTLTRHIDCGHAFTFAKAPVPA